MLFRSRESCALWEDWVGWRVSFGRLAGSRREASWEVLREGLSRLESRSFSFSGRKAGGRVELSPWGGVGGETFSIVATGRNAQSIAAGGGRRQI